MTVELLLVQFLVLAFTGALWWLARRDLSARALPAPPAPGESPELEQLCATLETLVTDLARRLERVERQLAEPAPTSDPSPLGTLRGASAWGGEERAGAGLFGREEQAGVGSPWVPPSELDARYAPVYALLDEGITDPQDIARRTELSRGEVDLILSLRARHAL